MNWEAQLIEALQKGSSAFLDYLMFGLTFLGDQVFFIGVICVIYWCFSKKFAFRFLNVYIVGAATNEGLKSIFRRPRPFQRYDSVRAIIHKTSGYSFPSGHSRSIGCIAAQLTTQAKKQNKHVKATLIASALAVAIVMFTRMYLGQHYLTDVVTGAALGIALAIVFNYFYNFVEHLAHKFYLVTVPLSVVVTLVLIIAGAGMTSLVQGLAAYAAACLGYNLENKYVDYNPKSGSIKKQLAKIAIGLACAALIMLAALGLKTATEQHPIAQTILASFIPYFLVGLWAFLAAPLVFKKLNL